MNFSNSTKSYTFSSTGGFGIGGTAILTKSGTGSVTLNTANTYSGGTVLNAGTINVDHASGLGTGAVTVNGGTLDNTSGSPVVLARATRSTSMATSALPEATPWISGVAPQRSAALAPSAP